MVLVILAIGVILVVAAIRNSQEALFGALAKDVPGFVVWGAAILALGVVGFVPGLKPVSRGLLLLVLLVIILKNYQAILSDFQGLWQNPGASSGVQNVSNTGATGPTSQNALINSVFNSLDFSGSGSTDLGNGSAAFGDNAGVMLA